MRAAAFLYPWDVVGDPDAPARLAALGIRQVTLASAYHSTRALTPRHPRHRVVTATHAAVLYPPGERWRGRELRPYAAGDWAPGDAYGEAAEALAAAGIHVHSWAVLAHNSRMGEEHPATSVVNAYGDRYPWAPCIARPATRAYLVDLAAEAAVRPGTGTRGTELESCGWYGLAHLHAHDKTAGVGLGEAGQYLMSLCFCSSCRVGYAGQGLDPDEAAALVRRALEPVWRGEAEDAGWASVEKLIGADTARATRAWRRETARTLQEAAIGAVRAAAPPGFQVLLHADPVPYHCGANAGVDPAHILTVADGVVVPCTGGAEALTPFAEHAGAGTVLAANLTVVRGMGGSPATLAADAARAAQLGATELRLYHAGLASDADLAHVAKVLSPPE
ncbi:hypothetical protein DMA15_08075 [Streptomyces sp. WAC 01529]|uniref:hypothetical protein n=1 Tax=Streptomyces sp. WAC 01529 TaxID=2203205 RepID=UPI000F6D0D64|nr:hypothetical protein [Streptomyces sp. WAC 01529]AZM52561.1 hypothetical protein DMA15_08075 [Streptomyces sp. WAC 01529]